MTPAQIARLKELDATRTRCRWLIDPTNPLCIYAEDERSPTLLRTEDNEWGVDDAAFIAAIANAAPALIEAVEEVEKLREELRALCRAYVSLLEAGADCIASLGGACDPVSVMEARDHALRRARAALQGSAPEQKEQA